MISETTDARLCAATGGRTGLGAAVGGTLSPDSSASLPASLQEALGSLKW